GHVASLAHASPGARVLPGESRGDLRVHEDDYARQDFAIAGNTLARSACAGRYCTPRAARRRSHAGNHLRSRDILAPMQNTEKRKSMVWTLFALGAALSWGFYGVALYTGQVKLGGNGMKALLFVGVAYFLIGVLAPVATLGSAGQLNNFPGGGM